MTFSKGLILSVSAMTILSACSNDKTDCRATLFGDSFCTATTTTATGEPTDEVQVSSSGGSTAADFISVSYDDNGTATTDDDTMTFVGGDFDSGNSYSRDPSRDRGGMLAFVSDFQSQSQRYYAVNGQTPSREINVNLVATPDNFQAGDYLASFERVGGNTAPASGNANYTGQYAGTATNTQGAGTYFTEGTLVLFVEFGENGRVKGNILNRTVDDADSVGVPSGTYSFPANIVMNESTMNADGIFNEGTVSTYDGDGDLVGSGSYAGTLGGPSGSETGGAIQIQETWENTGEGEDLSIQELGVFTGTCVPGAGLTCP